jgi:hypothetical protein
MVVKMSVLIWVVLLYGLVPASIFIPEDGDSMFLQNISIHLWVHMVSQPRTTTSSVYIELLSRIEKAQMLCFENE